MTSPGPIRWLLCGLLLLATTLNYLDRMALNQLINTIRVELKLNETAYAELESNFAIAFGLGTLAFGWLVDRVNVRWVYPAIVLGWSLAGFCTGFAGTFGFLMVCRVALGFFEAGNWPCGIRTTRTVLPPDERSFGNALFQSGTAIGAIITPLIILLCFEIFGDGPGTWVIPFRAIGLIGFTWVIAWFVLAPKALFPPPEPKAKGEPFAKVLADRRFWVLVAVILGANSGWHAIRSWMPRMLQETYGLDQREIQYFSSGYYLAADLGSWTVGLATLYFSRRGRDLHRLRRLAFLTCTVLFVVMSTQLHSIDNIWVLAAVMFATGFAALGLFPTYFALSQELSAKHQGKVTGVLGCINALALAGAYRIQGPYADRTHDYATIIAVSGIPAVVACVALTLGWGSACQSSEPIA